MKTTSIKSILFLAIAGMFAVSCNKEVPNGGAPEVQYEQVTIKADLPQMSKTTLVDGYKVNWETTDQVAVLAADAADAAYEAISPILVTLTGETATSAEITYSAITGLTPKYIVYPSGAYANVAKTDAALTISMTAPTEVAPQLQSFSSEANLSLGAVDAEGNAQMKNLMGLVKFEITSEDIVSVTFSGVNEEKIAGAVNVDAATLAITPAETATTSIVLKNANNAALAAGVYYIPVVPTNFTGGVKLTLTKSSGSAASKTWKEDTGYALVRNKIAYLGQESGWNLEYPAVKLSKTLTASFENKAWPFDGDKPSSSKQQFDEGERHEWDSSITTPYFGPYYLTNGDDPQKIYPFYFYDKVAGDVSNNYFTVSNAGWRMGGDLNDYILLPAVEGLRLVKVTIKVGNANTWLAVTNNETDAEGNPTQVLAPLQKMKGDNDNPVEVVWEPVGTLANTAYRLNWSADETGAWSKTSGIKVLILVYEE